MPADLLSRSLQSLSRHRMRSLLTMLGVLLGILLVVLAGNVGAGFEQQIIDQTASGGARSIQFAAGNKSNLNFRPLPIFTADDVGTVASNPHVTKTAPVNLYPAGASQAEISVGSGAEQVLTNNVTATTADFFAIRDLSFDQGSAFGDDEQQCAFGATAASQYGVSLGERVTLSVPQAGSRPIDCAVSGVLARLPNAQLGGDSSVINSLVAVPLSLAGNPNRYTAIYAQADSTDDLESTEAEIEGQLGRVPATQEALRGSGLEVIGLSRLDDVKQVSSVLDNVQIFVVFIAALAALIGGIGIANTMLVTVAERTREIAIMRAVGATRQQIRLLFVTESLLIGLVATLIGLALGLALSALVNRLAGFPVVFAPWTIVLGAGLGLLVGTGAGLYPARRAAGSDIKEALAHE